MHHDDAHGTSTANAPRARSSSACPRFLLIDPVPGSCVVFNGSVPHFVLPSPESAGQAGVEGEGTLRISAAFNFGACDPVLTHCYVQVSPKLHFA